MPEPQMFPMLSSYNPNPTGQASMPYQGIYSLTGNSQAAPAYNQMAPMGTNAATSGMPFGLPGQEAQSMIPGSQPGATPGGGWKGWLGNSQNLAAVVQGIGALSSAYLGFQQLKLAKESLGLQKQAYKTNMRNSTQTYNTSLEDRIRGRTSAYEGKEMDVNKYLQTNRLSPTP